MMKSLVIHTNGMKDVVTVPIKRIKSVYIQDGLLYIRAKSIKRQDHMWQFPVKYVNGMFVNDIDKSLEFVNEQLSSQRRE